MIKAPIYNELKIPIAVPIAAKPSPGFIKESRE